MDVAFAVAVDGIGVCGEGRGVEEAGGGGEERSSAACGVQLLCLSGRVSGGIGAGLE